MKYEIKERYNRKHYIKVREARIEEGLPVNWRITQLVGKKVIVSDGKTPAWIGYCEKLEMISQAQVKLPLVKPDKNKTPSLVCINIELENTVKSTDSVARMKLALQKELDKIYSSESLLCFGIVALYSEDLHNLIKDLNPTEQWALLKRHDLNHPCDFSFEGELKCPGEV